jgi:hypothetical protein
MDTTTGLSPGTQPNRDIRLRADVDPDIRDPVLPLLYRIAAALCDFLDLLGCGLGGTVLTQPQWLSVNPDSSDIARPRDEA